MRIVLPSSFGIKAGQNACKIAGLAAGTTCTYSGLTMTIAGFTTKTIPSSTTINFKVKGV
jgi:hypothetical protein